MSGEDSFDSKSGKCESNIEVLFENMQKSIAPGQSVVLYDGDIVLGGGIIL